MGYSKLHVLCLGYALNHNAMFLFSQTYSTFTLTIRDIILLNKVKFNTLLFHLIMIVIAICLSLQSNKKQVQGHMYVNLLLGVLGMYDNFSIPS